MVIRSSIARRPIKLVGSHISVSLFSSTLIFPLAWSTIIGLSMKAFCYLTRAGNMHGLSWCAYARLLIRARKPTKTLLVVRNQRDHVTHRGNTTRRTQIERKTENESPSNCIPFRPTQLINQANQYVSGKSNPNRTRMVFVSVVDLPISVVLHVTSPLLSDSSTSGIVHMQGL